MRLRDEQIEAIKGAVHRHFGSTARVFLFGSRVDDSKSGGDIDLLVEHDGSLTGGSLVRAKLKTMSDIQFAIGEMKIDIVTVDRNTEGTGESEGAKERGPLIIREARKEAVEL